MAEVKTMRLIYTATGAEVRVGDTFTDRDGETMEVSYFRVPHKPSSSGHVSIRRPGDRSTASDREVYVGVIGAEWVDREDRR